MLLSSGNSNALTVEALNGMPQGGTIPLQQEVGPHLDHVIGPDPQGEPIEGPVVSTVKQD